MTEYGQAFYGSDDLYAILNGEIGAYYSPNSGSWQLNVQPIFKGRTVVYKLRKNHWFYKSDQFKNAKKPSDEIANPLSDYSDDELQNKIKSMQSEIDRRKAQDDEITILARKVCADNYRYSSSKTDFISGNRDDKRIMSLAKAAIIAGMELQKGRET